MSRRTPPIARIRLARSVRRILLLPALLVAAGLALPAVAALGPTPLPPPLVIAAAGGGGLLGLVGMLVAVRPLSARLDVEEEAVRLHWLGGERIYALSPGPVTRVRFRGEGASSLRPRPGAPGWILGPARLRDEEEIEIVRLAPTPTAILVPTERGRLAICARSEEDLLDALSRAARARRRLEELATATAPTPAPQKADDAEAGPIDVDEGEPEVEAAHALTGIERALLEERLAREAEAAPPTVAEGAASVADVSQAPPASTPATEAAEGRRKLPGGLPRPRSSAALVVLPLAAAGVVWGTAALAGRLPGPTSDLGRLTALGLVLAGPATAIGAIMALAWWPRLVGVIVSGGVVAAALVGRALLGAPN